MYAVVDIEATGGNHLKGKIIEIAIYSFDGEKIVDEYTTLINPEVKVDWYVTKLTGITNAMVSNAPLFAEVAQEIYRRLEGKIFVAHDVDFDYRFVKTELNRVGFELNEPKVCTIQLSEKHLPEMESYSLGKLCEALKIPIPEEDRHRAGGDALATTKLLAMLLSDNKEAGW
ncbi:MAG: 3'-5' exonuclease [Flavobacteriales bacterium]|nr:3'-5' exonuclease [Flavobacteriales bacterium]